MREEESSLYDGADEGSRTDATFFAPFHTALQAIRYAFPSTEELQRMSLTEQRRYRDRHGLFSLTEQYFQLLRQAQLDGRIPSIPDIRAPFQSSSSSSSPKGGDSQPASVQASAGTIPSTPPSPSSSSSSSSPSPSSSSLQNPVCSVCLDDIVALDHQGPVKEGGVACAQLACMHKFHLSCIGSYFNSTGMMKCPTCRFLHQQQPGGGWRYSDRPPAPTVPDPPWQEFLGDMDASSPRDRWFSSRGLSLEEMNHLFQSTSPSSSSPSSSLQDRLGEWRRNTLLRRSSLTNSDPTHRPPISMTRERHNFASLHPSFPSSSLSSENRHERFSSRFRPRADRSPLSLPTISLNEFGHVPSTNPFGISHDDNYPEGNPNNMDESEGEAGEEEEEEEEENGEDGMDREIRWSNLLRRLSLSNLERLLSNVEDEHGRGEQREDRGVYEEEEEEEEEEIALSFHLGSETITSSPSSSSSFSSRERDEIDTLYERRYSASIVDPFGELLADQMFRRQNSHSTRPHNRTREEIMDSFPLSDRSTRQLEERTRRNRRRQEREATERAIHRLEARMGTRGNISRSPSSLSSTSRPSQSTWYERIREELGMDEESDEHEDPLDENMFRSHRSDHEGLLGEANLEVQREEEAYGWEDSSRPIELNVWEDTLSPRDFREGERNPPSSEEIARINPFISLASSLSTSSADASDMSYSSFWSSCEEETQREERSDEEEDVEEEEEEEDEEEEEGRGEHNFRRRHQHPPIPVDRMVQEERYGRRSSPLEDLARDREVIEGVRAALTARQWGNYSIEDSMSSIMSSQLTELRIPGWEEGEEDEVNDRERYQRVSDRYTPFSSSAMWIDMDQEGDGDEEDEEDEDEEERQSGRPRRISDILAGAMPRRSTARGSRR
ncbi:MAG: hypothetical protein DHS80DRAFT_25006 [Piptocephalis tieghemiana]|nr:MAG: hypothetical protein DHS80DRAFT_25006 [Piptocephalis tieghemiana]